MVGEYRVAKGWRIFVYVFSPILIGAFAYLCALPFFKKDQGVAFLFIFLALIGLGGIALFTYGLLETIVGKMIISQNSITVKSLFRLKTLAFSEIRAFSSDDKYVSIFPKDTSKETVKFSRYTEKIGEIIYWLERNFPDMHKETLQLEKEEILTNEEFGLTETQREEKLKGASRTARLFNIGGGLLAAWISIYPFPYNAAVITGIIYPLAAFAILFLFHGLIRFNDRPNSAYPSIFFGFLFPSLALLIRGLVDYEMLNYSGVWIITAVMAIAQLIIIFLAKSEKLTFKIPADYVLALCMVLFFYIHSLGSYIVINCAFDKSLPVVHMAEVVDKEISKGKTTTYYLKLGPWGPRAKSENISVTKKEYGNTPIGAKVNVYLKEGVLKTPWFQAVVTQE